MLIRFAKRVAHSLSIPLPERAVQVVRTTRFKSFFLDYIRNHRLHFPEANDGQGVDFSFIEYRHNPTPPNEVLFDLVAGAVKLLNQEYRESGGFASASPEMRGVFDYNNHYLLLTALGRVSAAKKIVEVGTASGTSLWAWLRCESVEGVNTWDVIPLNRNKSWFQSAEIQETVERALDADIRWTQHVENLIDPKVWEARAHLFRDADVIWIDGPHDPAIFEIKLMDQILALRNERTIIMLFDDIELSDMLDFWRDLPIPKLNITPVGHQSGTGLAILLPFRERSSHA